MGRGMEIDYDLYGLRAAALQWEGVVEGENPWLSQFSRLSVSVILE